MYFMQYCTCTSIILFIEEHRYEYLASIPLPLYPSSRPTGSLDRPANARLSGQWKQFLKVQHSHTQANQTQGSRTQTVLQSRVQSLIQSAVRFALSIITGLVPVALDARAYRRYGVIVADAALASNRTVLYRRAQPVSLTLSGPMPFAISFVKYSIYFTRSSDTAQRAARTDRERRERRAARAARGARGAGHSGPHFHFHWSANGSLLSSTFQCLIRLNVQKFNSK